MTGTDHQRIADVCALLASAGIGGVGVWGEVLPGGVDALEGVGLVLGTVVLGGVFLRRRWPVVWALATILVGALTPLLGFAGLVGIYTVAVHRRWPAAVGVTALAVLTSVVTLAAGIPDPFEFRFVLGSATLVLVTALLLGLFVGARRALLASLRERAERAEAERELLAERARTAERRRIAREMHDVLGHRLSLLSVHAGALELRPDLSQEKVHATAATLRATARAAMDDLRGIVLVLREPVGAVGPEDDPDSPQRGLADLPALVEESRAAGVDVGLTRDVAAEPPSLLGRTAYRVVQEGLTNARRHAAGAPVRVGVDGAPGGSLVVRVSTARGRGPTGERGSGTGLIGLTERVALAGGALTHGGDGTGGHVLTASMPWPAADDDGERRSSPGGSSSSGSPAAGSPPGGSPVAGSSPGGSPAGSPPGGSSSGESSPGGPPATGSASAGSASSVRTSEIGGER